MTASTRFLGMAVLAWAGVRAVSLAGFAPGTGAAASSVPAHPVETPAPTLFAPLDPVSSTPQPYPYEAGAGAPYPQYAYPPRNPYPQYAYPHYGPPPRDYPQQAYVQPVYLPPIYYPASSRQSRARAYREEGRPDVADTLMPEPRRLPSSGESVAPEAPPAQLASALPGSHPPTFEDPSAPPLMRRSLKLELSSWAMMRGKPGDLLGPNSLSASGGSLGGSQAGARMTYWVTPNLGASLRASSPIGGARGGEAALGLRYRPWQSVPIAITAERRQRFGRAGGRNDFAMFVEGGLWDKPMPMGFRLDGYIQAGVVGIKSHDLFGDGALTLTRPLWRNISGGFGVWGGAQPHLYRLDAGPRLSIRMKKGIRVHLDYRRRLRGTAFPSSGPAVTIAGDF
jgi:hypothetical protein